MSLSRLKGIGRIILFVVVLGGALAIPVSGASASDASIKAVIKSYDSKLLVANGHLETAIGEYKKSRNPSGVQAALQKSIAVYGSLKAKIAMQPASTQRVKLGKVKFDKGLQSIVLAYQRLKKAFGEKKVSPAEAKAEAKKALSAVKAARTQLREGAKLLE
jgi:hypothetical protein